MEFTSITKHHFDTCQLWTVTIDCETFKHLQTIFHEDLRIHELISVPETPLRLPKEGNQNFCGHISNVPCEVHKICSQINSSPGC